MRGNENVFADYLKSRPFLEKFFGLVFVLVDRRIVAGEADVITKRVEPEIVPAGLSNSRIVCLDKFGPDRTTVAAFAAHIFCAADRSLPPKRRNAHPACPTAQ